jgi:glycosyltransferase involved in cell wall biosynthesis
MRQIRDYRLDDMITFVPSIKRSDLRDAYATHDALFFHSVNAEPVALVLMEAFAAGLPVAASIADPGARLVQEGVTCICYQSRNITSLTEAVVTVLTDTDTRKRIADNASQLVRKEFSLSKMGDSYHEALCQLVVTQPAARALDPL